MDKAREVPRWRESDVFTPLEREVLEYAEAMTETAADGDRRDGGRAARPARRRRRWSSSPRSSRSPTSPPAPNVALGIESEGFAAACGLKPLARADRRSVVDVHDRRPVRRPPQPALHRRLRDARLGRRRRGRRAGDLAAVGATVDQRAEVRDPRAYLVRIVTRQALNRLRTLAAAARGVRRRVAARAAADQPRTWPRTSSSPRASRSRCSPCSRRSTPTERAVFVLREVFDVPYDEIAEARRQVPGRGAPDRAPGPGARRGAPAADGGRAAASSRRSSSGSSPR